MKSRVNSFAFSPHRPLYCEWLFWASILVPILIGMLMILTTLPTRYTFAWTADGFNHFLELSKLPLGIASLSIPLGTIAAVMHRSAQTSKQIELSLELSKNKDFKEHRNDFIDEFKGFLPKECSVNVNHLYKVFFPESLDRDYKIRIPVSLISLFNFINESPKEVVFKNLFSDEYYHKLSSDEYLKIIIEEKANFILKISKLLDEVLIVVNPKWDEYDVLERNGISDEDDLFFRCSNLALDCKNMFSIISNISNAMMQTSNYHFIPDMHIDVLRFFSESDIAFDTEPDSELFILFGNECQDVIDKVMHDDGFGNKENGNLVALTFRIIEC